MESIGQAKDKRWYNKKGWLIIIFIIFWPAGLYGVYKSDIVSKGWKIGIFVLIGVMILVGFSGYKGDTSPINVSNKEFLSGATMPLESFTFGNYGNTGHQNDYIKYERIGDYPNPAIMREGTYTIENDTIIHCRFNDGQPPYTLTLMYTESFNEWDITDGRYMYFDEDGGYIEHLMYKKEHGE